MSTFNRKANFHAPGKSFHPLQSNKLKIKLEIKKSSSNEYLKKIYVFFINLPGDISLSLKAMR